jgi:hypothetical protein
MTQAGWLRSDWGKENGWRAGTLITAAARQLADEAELAQLMAAVSRVLRHA